MPRCAAMSGPCNNDANSLLRSQRLGAIWLFSSATANSVYRFIRFQQNRKPTSSAVPDKPASAWAGKSLLLALPENSITQTDRFSRKRDDKSLCDSNIAQCVIPAKLVLDLIGERESTQPVDYWIPAFAGMTRRTGQFELLLPLSENSISITTTP